MPWDDSRTLYKPQYIFVNLGKSWSVEKNKTTKRLLLPYSIWLTQKMMATLYDVGLPTINEHIKKIYADSELEETATIRNFRIVQTEGSRQVTRDTKHYNLQMVIAVGFKVNSERAVQFRKWVNQIAKDLHHKGLGHG